MDRPFSKKPRNICPLCDDDETCPGEHELVEAAPLRARIAELEAENQRLRALLPKPKASFLTGPFCGALSPGDERAEEPDDWPIKCTCEPGHEGKHMGGTRGGTLSWIDSTNWD